MLNKGSIQRSTFFFTLWGGFSMFYSKIITASLGLCGLLGVAAAYTNPIRNPGGVSGHPHGIRHNVY